MNWRMFWTVAFLMFCVAAVTIDGMNNGFHLDPIQWTIMFSVAGILIAFMGLISAYTLLVVHPFVFIGLTVVIAYFLFA